MKTIIRLKNITEISLEFFTKLLNDSHLFTPVTENQYLIKKLYSNNVTQHSSYLEYKSLPLILYEIWENSDLKEFFKT